MTENTKTFIFVLVAVGILLVAWAAQPRRLEERPEQVVGQLLVAEDFDPLKAASMEIMKYDEKEARVETFEVAHDKQKGVWSIPSHENYPADAKDHMAEAATTFVGLKILQLVTENPGDHKQYGVLDPDPRDPREGMGTRVIMKDKDGNTMVALIIGKEVPGQSDLRYVRRVGQDQVFVVPLKTDRLSTRFEDWIEKDLLKLNPWDIKEVEIRDYSVDIVRGMIIQRGQMTLEYNDTGDPRWKLAQDLQATEKGLQPVSLAPDEELNTSKLDDMKFALDDLKIVDVNRKPAGLSADLKAEETLITNREAVENLAARGFYPARVEDRYEIVSNEGEIRVLMKDGVEYLLRFGGPAGTGRTEEKQTPKPQSKSETDSKQKAEEQKTTPGMNRFIMVTARFNESAIPKPELEPLPEEPAEKTPTESKPEAKASHTSPETTPQTKSPEKPTSSLEKSSAEKSQPASKEKTQAKQSPEEAKKELEKRREEIKKENERKQKEYQEKLEQGRKKAKELNDRFAEWYYIISEETYKKIRLSRADIVKKKEKKEEEKPKSEQPEEKQPPKEHEHDHKHSHEQPSQAQAKESASTPEAKPQEVPKSQQQPKPSSELKPEPSQASVQPTPSETKPPMPPQTEASKPSAEPKPEESKPAGESKPTESKPAISPTPKPASVP
ncbi:MAG: DUF4340 domain-containing protein [Thermoguttaceae bacterium]|nr:DUF4340 domain-containing protein [Thermoguttaceae bacterium]MDW8039573.1 DUF4340 domain-containing protein [Thermoguttaceae bacterium]